MWGPGWGWNWGWWIVMGFGMVAFWTVVIVFGVWAVRELSGSGRRRHGDARAILEERFARGEISREEFEERRRALEEG